jgi:hypothetical protein
MKIEVPVMFVFRSPCGKRLKADDVRGPAETNPLQLRSGSLLTTYLNCHDH